MAYIGRQQSSGSFIKLDDISSQFNNTKTVFNLTIGNEAFFPGNPYTLLVSLGGVIQEPIKSFTIKFKQLTFTTFTYDPSLISIVSLLTSLLGANVYFLLVLPVNIIKLFVG